MSELKNFSGNLPRSENAAEKAIKHFLAGPCPLCGMIHGCSDTVQERLGALRDILPRPKAPHGKEALREAIAGVIVNGTGGAYGDQRRRTAMDMAQDILEMVERPQ